MIALACISKLILVNLPQNDSNEPTSTAEDTSPSGSATSEPTSSMQEFYQLQQDLLLVTIALTGIIFVSVWFAYSVNIALNYLIGACTGVVYLRMLAKDVERIGVSKERLSKNRLALFIGLIVVATQWNQLQIMPIFLGFLTYKAALIVYVLRTTLLPDTSNK
ncbi:MAG TPA: ATP synthase subunit I [Halomicronema sp.]